MFFVNLLLASFLALAIISSQTKTASDKTTSTPETVAVKFSEFFETSTSGLRPTAKLKSLDKQRVRLTGFMAQMESEPEGSFFLVPQPVFCDEEGGGNADIPPESVLVIVPFMAQQKIPFVTGPIEVSGVLELGNREHQGHVTAIRLTLDH